MAIRNLCRTGLKSKFTLITGIFLLTHIGAQWGDEGKGKLVDLLADKYDYCARFNGGANAGHTVIKNGKKYAFHLLPCGAFSESTINVIGNGCVVHLPTLKDEVEMLQQAGVSFKDRIIVSDRAHIVLNTAILADSFHEGQSSTFRLILPEKQIGTTKRGIGPSYGSKAHRYGVRIGDLKDWQVFEEKFKFATGTMSKRHGISTKSQEDLQQLKELRQWLMDSDMIQDTITLMHNAIKDGKTIMAEGANGCMLDLDFGTYPYVTSSTTTVGGVCTGLGVPPQTIESVIGVAKAYATRVGEGPFPTEQMNQIGDYIQKQGHEWGATTGRPRRCGWFDVPMMLFADKISNFTSLNITKLDVLDTLDEIKIGVGYKINGQKIDYIPSSVEELAKVQVEWITLPGWKQDISKIKTYDELPKAAKNYIDTLSDLLQIPISWIGTGPAAENMLLHSDCKE